MVRCSSAVSNLVTCEAMFWSKYLAVGFWIVGRIAPTKYDVAVVWMCCNAVYRVDQRPANVVGHEGKFSNHVTKVWSVISVNK